MDEGGDVKVGDWSFSFARGMDGETLELDWTGPGQQGAVEDGCYVPEAVSVSKQSIESINQSERLMVHCHFLLPLVDFPTAARSFFFFHVIVAITMYNDLFPSFPEQRHFGMLLTLRAAERLQKHFPTSSVTELDGKTIWAPVGQSMFVQDAAACLFLWEFFSQLILPIF